MQDNYNNFNSNQYSNNNGFYPGYAVNNGVSHFDGGLFELVVLRIIGTIVTVLSLGILLPWVYCRFYRWEVNHTVIDGRRLVFTGSAIGLFSQWIKWLILSFITLGIYGFWVNIKLKKWRTKHTHFVN